MTINLKKAQSIVEYVFILALVAILAIASLHLVGNRINRPSGKKMPEQTQTTSETEKLESSSCSEIGGNWDSESKVCAPN